jgi:hypothetical protein
MNNKLLRSELKSIVKECLVEILSEGLSGNKKNIIEENVASPKQSKKKLIKKRKININTNLTSDPVLNELLADTAKSTLHEQISADRGSNSSIISSQGDTAAKLVNNSSPDELFAGMSDKWASLAFS